MKNKLRIIISVLIAAFLLFLTFKNTNWQEVMNNLLLSNPALLFLAVLITFVQLSLRALRWKELIKNIGYKFSFKEAFTTYSAGTFLNITLPTQVGDLYRINRAKKYKASRTKMISTVYVERVLDITCILFLAFTSMFFITVKNEIVWRMLTSVIAFLLVIILVVVFLIKSEKITKTLLNKLLKIPVLKKYENKIDEVWDNFILGFKSFNLKNLITPTLLSILVWLLEATIFYLVLRAFNAQTSFIFTLFLIMTAVLLILVPLTPNGIGLIDFYLQSMLQGLLTLSLSSAVIITYRVVQLAPITAFTAVMFAKQQIK